MANRRDGKETQEQVLEAALEVFARKGYRETTVAEICRAAGANVAAVNYHFGGKEQLYAEVWQRAFAPARARAMLDEGLGAEASAEARLRALLRVMFSRILREGGQSLSGRLLRAADCGGAAGGWGEEGAGEFVCVERYAPGVGDRVSGGQEAAFSGQRAFCG